MCPRLREVHIDEDVATAAQAMQKLNIMNPIHIHPDNTVGLCKSSIVYTRVALTLNCMQKNQEMHVLCGNNHMRV